MELGRSLPLWHSALKPGLRVTVPDFLLHDVQVLPMHSPALQSVVNLHFLSRAHALPHAPPQSTSVSSPSFFLLAQLAAGTALARPATVLSVDFLKALSSSVDFLDAAATWSSAFLSSSSCVVFQSRRARTRAVQSPR